ncbi:serine O-acetyltransferase [Methanosphaerula palustris]|nr:serine acetyltransferase [Methanosphaerula palustris]
MRTVDYNHHCRSAWWWAPYRAQVTARFHLMGLLLKFTIPPGAFGPGLALANRGTIVVHPDTRGGENCRIHIGVTIGAALDLKEEGPRLGNNIYIGPGAAIVGGVTIADDVAIGAKSVVIRSITDPGVTVVGAPARTISRKGSDQMIRATAILRNQGRPHQ